MNGQAEATALASSGFGSPDSPDGHEIAAGLPARQAARVAMARRVRLRAQVDLLAVAVGSTLAALLGSTTHEALLAGSAALSIGILAYVIRRDRDLVALAAASRWREQAVAGRGLALAEWRRGVPLQPWPDRRDGPVEELA